MRLAIGVASLFWTMVRRKPEPDGTADVATDEIAEFRVAPRQLRNMLVAAAVFFGVAVVLGGIAYGTGFATLAAIALSACFVALFYLHLYVASGYARTVCGPAGISVRGRIGRFARREEYRWEQVANISRRRYAARGTTEDSVMLTTIDDDRILLGAPVSYSTLFGSLEDPDFDAKLARMRRIWQAAGGRTGPETGTKPMWRVVLLMTAAFVVQVVAAGIFAGIASSGTAWSGARVSGLVTSGEIVLILLAAEIAVPVYRGRRQRRRARAGLDRFGGPLGY